MTLSQTDTKQCCPGCGGAFTVMNGSVHKYMSASPACWHAYGNLLAAEYESPELMLVHNLSVDCYAVQHSGGDDRRARQSVIVHLVRLYVLLENITAPDRVNTVMQSLASARRDWPRLQGPSPFTKTVADIYPYAGTAHHADMVKDWAQTTWADWANVHDYIEKICAAAI